MNRRTLFLGLAPLTSFALAVACAGEEATPGATGSDKNGDAIADDLGNTVDKNGDGYADNIDINKDGLEDGPGIDTNGDGIVDALGIDVDCDGIYDSIDTSGDGKADFVTGSNPSCMPGGLGSGGSNSGTGGTSSTGGTPSTGGTSSTGGTPSTGGTTGGSSATGGTAGTGGTGTTGLGNAQYQGTGTTTDQYAESPVYRNGVGYFFIANGWGSGWQSHNISWNGTSFTVASLNGSQGENYSPAGYPTVFCGNYSMKQSPGMCGLPATISSVQTLKTGWRWKAGSGSQYNAAWDIWIGNGSSLSAYLMLWLRDPPGQQPAGAAATAGATVAGLPGTWSIWTGSVNGKPIVNYVRAEGQDLGELEFDVKALYQDAINRNYSLPGTHFMSVAIGFEVWNGPVTNLVTEDFYVEVN
jgi:hypothetical protein